MARQARSRKTVVKAISVPIDRLRSIWWFGQRNIDFCRVFGCPPEDSAIGSNPGRASSATSLPMCQHCQSCLGPWLACCAGTLVAWDLDSRANGNDQGRAILASRLPASIGQPASSGIHFVTGAAYPANGQLRKRVQVSCCRRRSHVSGCPSLWHFGNR